MPFRSLVLSFTLMYLLNLDAQRKEGNSNRWKPKADYVHEAPKDIRM